MSAVPIESLSIRKSVATSPCRDGMETTQNHMRKGTSEKVSESPVSKADHYTTFVKWLLFVALFQGFPGRLRPFRPDGGIPLAPCSAWPNPLAEPL